MDYEAVIGLEVHVQLKTKTKLFTAVPYTYGASPNLLTNEVVLGFPGTLPVINKEAVLKTVQIGLMFGCDIARRSKWDRKNYFYPDAPKNYQISQYDEPLCLKGSVEIELPGPARNIQGKHRKVLLNRIHLEEDVGKLIHVGQESLIDFNRAGTPLVEIVSEPDLHSSEEVFAYLKSLVMHLQYVDASDCDMEKGQLRCDANISVRPKGSLLLGTKVELKNMNSISGVCGGVEHEIARQVHAISQGEAIVQETRRWDAESGTSVSMRSKEDAHDYRYFPDPDLKPIRLSEQCIAELSNVLPERPFVKQERYQKEFNLPYTVTSVICPDKRLSDFFELALKNYDKNPLGLANWIANDLLRELSGEDRQSAWKQLKILPEHVTELTQLIDQGKLSKQSAKEVFVIMCQTGEMPQAIVKARGLEMSFDVEHLKQICKEVIAAFSQAAEEFRGGKEKAINVLKGQVMKHTQGKVPAAEVDRTLRSLL